MAKIEDTLTYIDGSKANGRLVVAWKPFSVSGVNAVGGELEYPIVDGVLSVELYSNTAALPSGSYYVAKYELENGAVYVEQWMVPDLPTVNLGQVRVAFPPSPSVMISPLQLTSLNAAPGMFLTWNGTRWVPGYPTTFSVDPNWIVVAAGAAGSDVNVTGSPVSLGSTVTINIPDAGAAARGVVTTGAQTFAGAKTFAASLAVTGNVDITGAYLVNGAPLTSGVASVFSRTGAVVAAAGDYVAAQVTNAVDSTAAYANPVWITALAWSKITGTPVIYVDPLVVKGDLVARDGFATGRLPVGSNGQVLTADTASVQGIKWATPAAGGGSQTPWTSDIDAFGHSLDKAGAIGVNAAARDGAGLFVQRNVASGPLDALSAVTVDPNNYIGIYLANDVNETVALRMYSSGAAIYANQARVEVAGVDTDLVFALGTSFATMVEQVRITKFGYVGIGTNNPTGYLTIGAPRNTPYSPADATTWADVLSENWSTAVNAATGIGFSITNTMRGDKTVVAGIAAIRNSTVADADTSLAFITRPPGATAVERMRITAAGLVGVGRIPTTYPLEVAGDVNLISGVYRVNGVALAAGFSDPTTTKGDLIARGTAALVTRLGVGSDGQVLTADVASTLGVKWATAGGSANYWVNGALVGTRPTLNLIAGSSVTLGGVDNFGANRVDITVTSTGAGGGQPQTPWASNIDADGFNLIHVNQLAIGAGLSTPLADLHIRSGANQNLQIGNMAWALAGAVGLNAVNDANNATIPLVFNASTSVFYGNVGVGTTAPQCALDTTGLIRTTGFAGSLPTSGAGMELFYNGGGYIQAYKRDAPAGVTNLYLSGAQILLNSSGGNVGIGTPAPFCRLTVAEVSRPYTDGGGAFGTFMISSQTGAQTDDNLVFGVHTGDYSWIQAIKAGAATRSLLLNPNGGNVGIGTAAPEYSLHVAGRAILVPASEPYALGLRYNASSTQVWMGLASDGSLQISDAAGTGHVWMTQGGNVGIAIANPGFLLSLGPAVTARKLAIYDAGGDFFGFGVRSSALCYDSGAASDHVFYTTAGANERMRITQAGNVGIGTASPASRLDVEGPQDATGGISIGSGGGADPGTYGYQIYRRSDGLLNIIGNQTGAAGFVFGNSTERMRITETGSVGIGTAAPQGVKLSLVPTTNATTVAGANFLTLGEATNAGGYYMSLGYFLDGGSIWKGSIQALSGGGAANLVLNGAGGGVAIGKVGPIAYALDVGGEVNATGFRINGTPISTGGITTQRVATGSRVSSTSYLNDTGKPMFVIACASASAGSTPNAYTDTGNPPTTQVVSAFASSSTLGVVLSFWVLPGSWYRVLFPGTITSWIEWF